MSFATRSSPLSHSVVAASKDGYQLRFYNIQYVHYHFPSEFVLTTCLRTDGDEEEED